MASTISHTDKTILHLPPEIRNQIWGLVVKREKLVHFRIPSVTNAQAHSKVAKYQLNNEAAFTSFVRSLDITNPDSLASTSNAILAVNHQVHAEALAVFFSINKFLITDRGDGWRLLVSLSHRLVDLQLGPVICWLDNRQTACRWELLLHLLKFRTEYHAGPRKPLKLYFETPKTPDEMQTWEQEFCIKKAVKFRVATEDDGERFHFREVPTTPLGKLVQMGPREGEGGLSLVQFASCLFHTEIGFFDTLAHIPH
ncbi:hypothetical protein PG985_014955 [Apiospora marii]|uniref:DUF7730 domain-containing protein n=1 Tax=Apiospora marii TaxID=335849 RepID=A0ABR1RIT2_9PEZI